MRAVTGRGRRAAALAAAAAFLAIGMPAATGSREPSGITVAGGVNNDAWKPYATVGGGLANKGAAPSATVAGGMVNSARGPSSTIGGGEHNDAAGASATVAGGNSNWAVGDHAAVGGGKTNRASGIFATVSGGYRNLASGFAATAPGGNGNVAAGDYSVVTGRNAHVRASHDGSFVFADASNALFTSTAANEFAVRASGGIRLYTSGDLSTGVVLEPGSGSWDTLSDAAAKANFASVDGRLILDAVAELPIRSWTWAAQDSPARHIGPTAQDFYRAFGYGDDDGRISAVDADGVSLVGIQALYEMARAQEARLERLEGVRNSEGAAGSGSWWAIGALLFAVGLVAGRRSIPASRSDAV